MDSQQLAAHADFAQDGEKTGVNLRIESMKKATKARMPSKAKAPTQKGKELVNPILDMLKNMDEDVVAMLRQTVQKENSVLKCLVQRTLSIYSLNIWKVARWVMLMEMRKPNS